MDSNYILTANGELYHWGIKGMKWGIRRYQNKDGSLTPAGKKRRAKLEAEIEKLGGKSEEKKLSEMTDDEVAAKTNRMRLENNLKEEMRRSTEAEQRQKKLQESLNETSTDELRNKITRLQLEEQYKNLANPKKAERDPYMDKLQKEVDRLTLEKRYRDLQKELNPPTKKEKSFFAKIGEKALNEVLVPTAMNAGKNYLEKTVKKLGLDTEDPVTKLEKQVRKLEAEKKIKKLTSDDEFNVADSLEKLMSMSDEDFRKIQKAAAAQGVINNLTGKKNKDK